MSISKTVIEIINSENLRFLLPQNLPDHIITVFQHAAVGLEENQSEPHKDMADCMEALIYGVLRLSTELKAKGTTPILETSDDELSIFVNNYVIAIETELLRREGIIEIEESSMPTLENILSSNRQTKVKIIKDEIFANI